MLKTANIQFSVNYTSNIESTSGFVYCWINNINSKWYIGSHKGSIDDGYVGSGRIFKQAIGKHGIENFTRHILYEGDFYREKEQEFLEFFDAANHSNSYNLNNKSFGGHECGEKHPMYGKKHTEETKAKMSENRKNRKHTKESKEKISKAHTGKIISNHTKEKLRCANTGRKHTKEELAKMQGRKMSEEDKEHLRKLNRGEGNPFYGRKHTEETLDKMRGSNNSMYGKKHTEETLRKISDSSKGENNGMYGKKHTEESIQKMSNSMKGKMAGEKHPNYGKNHSQETKSNISNALKNLPEVECPHCHLEGKGPNMKRYHFDNCKHKNKENV